MNWGFGWTWWFFLLGLLLGLGKVLGDLVGGNGNEDGMCRWSGRLGDGGVSRAGEK